MKTLDINQPRVREALGIILNREISEENKITKLEKDGWCLTQIIDLAFLADEYETNIRAWRMV